MRSVFHPRVQRLVACVSLAIAAFTYTAARPSFAEGPPAFGTIPKPTTPPKPPSTTKHPFSMSIVSVAPSAAIAGQKVTISYVVRNLAAGTIFAHVAGSVAGENPQTADGRPPVESAYPGNQEVKGSFVISAGAAGPNSIELFLMSTPCGVSSSGGPACAPTIYTSAITLVAVAAAPLAPTVRVRIAGTTYADVHMRSKEDTVTPNAGYAYVSHDPDCRAGYFASGNNGNDTYFKKHDLPAGVKLVGVDFTVYGPPIMKSYYYKGGVGGSGSYGVELEHDSGDALHVHWENTCQGPFRDIKLDYSISFEVEVPKGMDLGETATDATQQPRPPTIPDGLDELSDGTNAAAALVPAPVYFKLASNGNGDFYASFAPALAGTVSAIKNDRPYPVTLIADSRLGAGCGPARNVVLASGQTTTAAELTALYGTSTVHSPKTVTACAQAAPAKTTEVEIILTFLPD